MRIVTPKTVTIFNHQCPTCGLLWGHGNCSFDRGIGKETCWACDPNGIIAVVDSSLVAFQRTPDEGLSLEDRKDSFLVWVNWTRAKHLSG